MRYLLILSWLIASPAWAGETGQQVGTVISLSAAAEAMLPNDEVVVRYRIEAEGKNPELLQHKVDGIADKIGKVLAAREGLKRQTTGRRLQQTSHYDKASGRQLRDGWRLVQGEKVTSRNLDAVPVWVDSIEKDGAHLDGLDFRLSRQAREAAMQTLRSQAVARFRRQASSLAKALDAASFDILRLNTTSRPPIVPVQRGVMAMSAQRSEIVLNVGESRLQITVTGDIQLPAKRFPVK